MAVPTPLVALLRGINVGGRRKVPMAALRELCEGLGFRGAATYVQSGNVVFSATGRPDAVAQRLGEALAARFGFEVDVVVRTAAQWERYAAGSPFPDAESADPSHLLLFLTQRPPAPGAAAALRERARHGERIAQSGDALWVHFPQGVARSKLTPALLDRVLGAPATGRNWNTVVALRDLAAGRG